MVRRLIVAWLCALLLAPAAAAASAGDRAAFESLIADARAAMLSDPQATVEKARAAERVADQEPVAQTRAVQQATAMWLRGEALTRLNDVNHAEPLIATALRLAARVAPGSKLHGDTLLAGGWISTMRGNVAAALSDYQQAHAIFQALHETRSQSKALQSIGSLYGYANDYTNALKYYSQALAVHKSDPMLALTLYNNRGNSLIDLHRYAEAEAEFQQALALSRQMESPLLQAMVLGNIAEARLMTNDIVGAQRVIDRGLSLARREGGSDLRKLLLGVDAQAAFQRGELRHASALIGERFADEDLAKTTLLERAAHRTAYTIYRADGEHDLALQHLVALKRLDDEATDLARSTNAALMAARFDFANQELKIASLQRDEARRNVAFEQAHTRTQRNIFLSVVAATVVAIIVLGFGILTLRRSRNEVRAANDDLAVTNTALGKALAAKTEFLATTSHEIRTPLNGILGMTQVMLADGGLGGATRDRLEVVHSAGVTMRALVDDILDIAKMETGNLVVEAAPFDLRALLNGSARMWEDQALAKGLLFHRDLDACPDAIVGDAARLRQIVFNLMANALKFTATGGVTLAVEIDRTADGCERLRIAITDTGVGIAPDKFDEIFESFRQADTSTTRQFGGTGLGLAICRNLARAMGGDVLVSSVPGEGSRFSVEVPLVRAATVTAPASAQDVAPAMLILDRNPITRSLLRTLMLPQARGVAVAATLEEALEVLRGGGIVRVLADADALAATGDTLAAALALSVAADAAKITLLWPADSEMIRAAVAAQCQITSIIKPIAGTALVENVFSPQHPVLVSQAA